MRFLKLWGLTLTRKRGCQAIFSLDLFTTGVSPSIKILKIPECLEKLHFCNVCIWHYKLRQAYRMRVLIYIHPHLNKHRDIFTLLF